MGHDHDHHYHAHGGLKRGHSNFEGKSSQRKSSNKALLGVLTLSSCYMVAEIVGGLWSGSLALLADAGHMAIDVAAIALSLFAAWVAQRPATPEKTYGYYRAEILAALVNGATLIAISLWICYEAWARFHSTQPINGSVMTGVAIGGLVVNLLGLILVHQHGSHSLNARGVWLHLLTDTLGSVSAIGAGFLVWKLGWTLADPIISVVISIFILVGSWKLLKECVDVLLEAVPKGVDIREIKSAIESLNGVGEAHDLHVWTVTSGVPVLSVHVTLVEAIDPSYILKKVTELLSDRFHIDHVTIQVEPKDYIAPEECCKLPSKR